MFVGVIFLVIYKFFSHIHSVMLIWTNDLPSKFTLESYKYLLSLNICE